MLVEYTPITALDAAARERLKSAASGLLQTHEAPCAAEARNTVNTNETERSDTYDRACRDANDNCPTENAVLRREWRQKTASILPCWRPRWNSRRLGLNACAPLPPHCWTIWASRTTAPKRT